VNPEDAAKNAIEAALLDLVAQGHQGVLATIKADGRPQLSVVNYAYYPDQRLVKVSITASRAKYRNLLRDPRASLQVIRPDGWAYAVLESTAELSAVATDEHDEAVEELVELFRAVQGEHRDWDDYRRAMVADQRVVLRLPIERAYGTAPRG
jgi:PPOX class probable F420-dependent enzyme